VTARYVCTEFSGELHPQESEIAELRWFSFDALPENLRPRKIERIKEYLKWRRDKKEKFSSLTIAE
jgi:NADH pyrophosphatase NudC (nudix superfamily)